MRLSDGTWLARTARYGPVALASVMLIAVAAPARVGQASEESSGNGFGDFRELPSSTPCRVDGGLNEPFLLPPGFAQKIIAREGDGGTLDLWDMNTQNETGARTGRYIYRTHEISTGGQVSSTDLQNNQTRVLAQRADWERFDGIVWTPWGTILAAEEVIRSSARDPQVPQAVSGLVYEFFVDRNDPTKLDPSREQITSGDGTTDNTRDGIRARPALGSKSHEGMRFDNQGNFYGISEAGPDTTAGGQPAPGGYIFKFTPDRRGDLSKGQLYALKITRPGADRTGEAIWVPLDRRAVQIDADAEATRKGATNYVRPEDVETDVITGRKDPLGNVLYVAVTGENRVLGVRLGGGGSGDDDDNRSGGNQKTFVFDYVRAGVNAPAGFTSPDNLALDKSGVLYITEDPSANPVGADIWAAFPPSRGGDDDDSNSRRGTTADRTERFASLKDCAAEPTGVYFEIRGGQPLLYVHVQHRGAPDTRDLEVVISKSGNNQGQDHDNGGNDDSDNERGD